VSAEALGQLYGFVGVCCFSLTLPATRAAVGLGRALVAGVLARLFLRAGRHQLPSCRQFKSLLITAAGVVGFPLLSAWALQRVPAAHGAIVFGLMPLATAAAGSLRAGERPSGKFRLAAGAGSATVVAFALVGGGGGMSVADLVLVGATALAALGYAEGGRLARELGGAQVICWALTLPDRLRLGAPPERGGDAGHGRLRPGGRRLRGRRPQSNRHPPRSRAVRTIRGDRSHGCVTRQPR
jgi:drug/metabolite transporter (DMT)-like permease